MNIFGDYPTTVYWLVRDTDDLYDVQMALVVSSNPVMQPTDLVVLPIGAYEEGSEYLISKIPKSEHRKFVDNDEYKKAAYGEIINLQTTQERGDLRIEYESNIVLMVMPDKTIPISIEKSIQYLKKCCYSVFEHAMSFRMRTVSFVIYPDETSSLPLTVKFHIMKQTILEIIREYNRRCPENCEFKDNCEASVWKKDCPAKHICPSDIDFRLDYLSYLDNNGPRFTPSDDEIKKLDCLAQDIQWVSNFDCSLNELLEKALVDNDAPDELKKYAKLLHRFPETKEQIKQRESLEKQLCDERKEYWDAHVRKTTPEDFAWHYLDKTIKKWIEDNAIPQNKIVSTLMKRSFLKKDKIYGILESLNNKNNKPTIRFPDRKKLFLLAVAMGLNETDRRKLISAREPAMLYPSSDEENQWEICLKDMLKRANKDRDNYEKELLNMLMELTKYGTKYQIYDKKKINTLMQQQEEKASEKRNKEDQKDAELESR